MTLLIVATHRIIGILTGHEPLDVRSCYQGMLGIGEYAMSELSGYTHVGYASCSTRRDGMCTWIIHVSDRGHGGSQLVASREIASPVELAYFPPSVIFVDRCHAEALIHACTMAGIKYRKVSHRGEVAVTARPPCNVAA